jgi:hypothetical protein
MSKDNKTNYIEDDYLIFDHKDIAKFINKNKHNIDNIAKYFKHLHKYYVITNIDNLKKDVDDIKNNIDGFDIKNSINDLDEAISENKIDIDINKNNIEYMKKRINHIHNNVITYEMYQKNKAYIEENKNNINRVKKECDTSELYTLIAYCFIGLGAMFFSNVVSWIMIIIK